MCAGEPSPAEPGPPDGVTSEPGGLLDVLRVAAAVLDGDGRIVLWSPQAEELLGYSAEEALGRYAGRLLVHEENMELVMQLFAQVMWGDGSWAGVFPVRHKDGSTLQVEFRNMRLLDEHGNVYALGLATAQTTLRRVERDLALTTRLVSQSPIGLALVDTDLRYVSVNPALERINGLPAAEHLGRHFREALPYLDVEAVESAMEQVLATGVPLVDQESVGRTPADPDSDHVWSVSYYRLEAGNGKVLGVAVSVVDVTERHRATVEAAHARRSLALIAEASLRIGTTLDLDQTARELTDMTVPELADVAAVVVLDAILTSSAPATSPSGPTIFRALAVSAASSSEAVAAADPPGELARYDADRLLARCVQTGRSVVVPHVQSSDLPYIAGCAEAADRPGPRRTSLLPGGAADRGRQSPWRPRPQTHRQPESVHPRRRGAGRGTRGTGRHLYRQRPLVREPTPHRSHPPAQPPPPRVPEPRPGLELAYRYQPASIAGEIGGDWFDVIPLTDDKTALVVGDVMGSGINAAATMGQLRTATRAFAELDLDPAQVLHHLDRLADRMGQLITTCIYAVYDPRDGVCRISNAGHLPPALHRPDQDPELLDLPAGSPLGVGAGPFQTTTLVLRPGDELLLYTDGLVETREQSIDERLNALLAFLTGPQRSLEETCDVLLYTLRHPWEHDDVALLILRAGTMAGEAPSD